MLVRNSNPQFCMYPLCRWSAMGSQSSLYQVYNYHLFYFLSLHAFFSTCGRHYDCRYSLHVLVGNVLSAIFLHTVGGGMFRVLPAISLYVDGLVCCLCTLMVEYFATYLSLACCHVLGLLTKCRNWRCRSYSIIGHPRVNKCHSHYYCRCITVTTFNSQKTRS